MNELIADAVCPACGCACDDVKLTLTDNQPTQVAPACPLAEKLYNTPTPSSTSTAEWNGQVVELETALSAAAELLNESKAPLIYGLSGASLLGQKAALAVADRLGGVLDVAQAAWSRGATLAMQQTGHAGCTLGEIKDRADLIIFWGADPAATHPRFLSRFCSGVSLPGTRHLAVVDGPHNKTRQQTARFIPLSPGDQLAAILFLRSQLLGRPHASALNAEAQTGLVELAQRMKTCQYGVLCVGPGLFTHRGEDTPHHEMNDVAAAHQFFLQVSKLTAELNAVARFQWMPMAEAGGAEAVVNWQTGYPGNVSFAAGHPIYSPSEYHITALLERKEVDACLLVGSHAWENVARSSWLQQQLSSIPTIGLKTWRNACHWRPTVSLTCADPGIQTANTLFRMDGIPLPQPSIIPAACSSDAVLLHALHDRLSTRLPLPLAGV